MYARRRSRVLAIRGFLRLPREGQFIPEARLLPKARGVRKLSIGRATLMLRIEHNLRHGEEAVVLETSMDLSECRFTIRDFAQDGNNPDSITTISARIALVNSEHSIVYVHKTGRASLCTHPTDHAWSNVDCGHPATAHSLELVDFVGESR